MSSETTRPMLSVRLMAYNHGQFIGEAIKGILAQKTDFPVEIVIGDDFSTDNTLSVVAGFDNTNNVTIKVLKRERGDAYDIERSKRGRLYNFQNIVENCSGKYVALLDGDDYWTDPEKLQKQVDFLEENEDYALTFHNVSTVNDHGELIDPDFLKTNHTVRSQSEMITGTIMPTCSVVFRNLVKFPPNFTSANNGDTFLFALLAKHGKAYMQSNVGNACYRVHQSGVWTTSAQYGKRRNSLKTYLEIKKDAHKKHYTALNRVLASTHYSLLKSSPKFADKLKSFFGLLKYVFYYGLGKFLRINL